VSIGGAGLLHPEKTPKRRRLENSKMFIESAKREIRKLEANDCPGHYQDSIRKIDSLRSTELN
jgi:hypothetical protein